MSKICDALLELCDLAQLDFSIGSSETCQMLAVKREKQPRLLLPPQYHTYHHLLNTSGNQKTHESDQDIFFNSAYQLPVLWDL